MNSGVSKWMSLFDSFNAIGEAEFGNDWEEDCWRLGPFNHEDIPLLIDKSKIDPAAYAENPHAWDDVDFATNDQIQHFN